MQLARPLQNDVSTEIIDVSAHPQFMDHHAIYRISGALEDGAQVVAFACVHNIALGPSLGGIRYKAYADEQAALADGLRLSEAMTWKNAAIGLNHGGGKTVIMAPEGGKKPTRAILEIVAEGLNQINSAGAVYYGAQDMNISQDDIDTLSALSPWMRGKSAQDPNEVGGSPSPLTAMAVVECIKVAAKHALGKDSLEGVRISMQGLGTVGGEMARLLHGAGAVLIGCDTKDAAFAELRAQGVVIEQVGLDEVYDVKADIFAPNAIGGILTDASVQRLHEAGVKAVCGAANNQQQDQTGGAQAKLMHSLGMLYSPDYIVNAGGVFWVAEQGKNSVKARDYIRTQVAKCFGDVLAMADEHPQTDLATLARDYAEARVEAEAV